MLCACHGEDAYWQKDARRKAGGWWECAVKRRGYSKHAYHDQGGWARKRRLQLRRERESLLSRLGQLQREAEDLAQ